MKHEDITLEQLSERSGVEARTLRSWVSEGLLSPPLKPGRGARYPAGNVDRALAVRALKELYGLSLADIGRRFMMATENEIREWALEAGSTTASRGAAREYLRQIHGGRAGDDPRQRSMELPQEKAPADDRARLSFKPAFEKPPGKPFLMKRSEERQAELASIERLILQLEQVLDVPAPRRARGTVWTRISITPDLELSVRGDLAPRERVLFEQLADNFRAILTGRQRHD